MGITRKRALIFEISSDVYRPDHFFYDAFVRRLVVVLRLRTLTEGRFVNSSGLVNLDGISEQHAFVLCAEAFKDGNGPVCRVASYELIPNELIFHAVNISLELLTWAKKVPLTTHSVTSLTTGTDKRVRRMEGE